MPNLTVCIEHYHLHCSAYTSESNLILGHMVFYLHNTNKE